MAKSNLAQNPKIEISGERGNVFSVLSTASMIMRSSGWPEPLIRQMHEKVMLADSYGEALKLIHEFSGCEIVFHGRRLVNGRSQ
jgi:hypothetical protein